MKTVTDYDEFCKERGLKSDPRMRAYVQRKLKARHDLAKMTAALQSLLKRRKG